MSTGLKAMRSGKGPVDPNKYWGRKPRPKCKSCRKRMRTNKHKCPGTVAKKRYA